MTFWRAQRELARDFDGGFNIEYVTDMRGNELTTLLNDTHLRVDLPNGLRPGQKVQIKIAWDMKIVDAVVNADRGGYEYFEEQDLYHYTIAQRSPWC